MSHLKENRILWFMISLVVLVACVLPSLKSSPWKWVFEFIGVDALWIGVKHAIAIMCSNKIYVIRNQKQTIQFLTVPLQYTSHQSFCNSKILIGSKYIWVFSWHVFRFISFPKNQRHTDNNKWPHEFIQDLRNFPL